MSHAKQLHHRRYLNDYLEIINREGLPGNVKTELCLTVQETVITTVQHVIEAALEADFSVQRLQPVSMRLSRLHPMKVLVIPGLPDRQSANSASD